MKTLNVCVSKIEYPDPHASSSLRMDTGPACIMRYFYRLLSILVLLKACPATALTLLPPSKPTLSLNSTPSNLTSRPLSMSETGFECNPHGPFPGFGYMSCPRVLPALPSASELHVFHRGGTADMYRLPYISIIDDCQILIDLEDDLREEVGIWYENFQKALQIVVGCVLSHNIGGSGLVGQHDRIRVSVGYRDPGASGDDSVTMSNIPGMYPTHNAQRA